MKSTNVASIQEYVLCNDLFLFLSSAGGSQLLLDPGYAQQAEKKENEEVVEEVEKEGLGEEKGAPGWWLGLHVLRRPLGPVQNLCRPLCSGSEKQG